MLRVWRVNSIVPRKIRKRKFYPSSVTEEPQRPKYNKKCMRLLYMFGRDGQRQAGRKNVFWRGNSLFIHCENKIKTSIIAFSNTDWLDQPLFEDVEETADQPHSEPGPSTSKSSRRVRGFGELSDSQKRRRTEGMLEPAGTYVY